MLPNTLFKLCHTTEEDAKQEKQNNEKSISELFTNWKSAAELLMLVARRESPSKLFNIQLCCPEKDVSIDPTPPPPPPEKIMFNIRKLLCPILLIYCNFLKSFTIFNYSHTIFFYEINDKR